MPRDKDQPHLPPDLDKLEERAVDALVQAMLCWQTVAREAHAGAVEDDAQSRSLKIAQALQALLYCFCADDEAASEAGELLDAIWQPASNAFDGRRFSVHTARNNLSWRLLSQPETDCRLQERRRYSEALRTAVAYCLRGGIDGDQVDELTQKIVADTLRPNAHTTAFARLFNLHGIDPRSLDDSNWMEACLAVRVALFDHAGGGDTDEVARRVVVAAFKALGMPPEAAESMFDPVVQTTSPPG